MFIRNLIPNREVSTQCSTNIDQRRKIELASLPLLEPWIRKRSIHVLSSQVSFLLRSVSGFESWLQYWTNDWWRGKDSENRKELIYLCTAFVSLVLKSRNLDPWRMGRMEVLIKYLWEVSLASGLILSPKNAWEPDWCTMCIVHGYNRRWTLWLRNRIWAKNCICWSPGMWGW